MKMKTHLIERAEINRRSEGQLKLRFPIKVPTGEVVLRDRRVNPDRRHPGLQTCELNMTSEEFNYLFEAYQEQK